LRRDKISLADAWLMVSLGAGPMYVALTQTASALPFVVFALPAGAIGDIVDRRKLILYTEFWMVGIATMIAVATIGGFMSPWLLLGLTFALSAGMRLKRRPGERFFPSSSEGISRRRSGPERDRIQLCSSRRCSR
jgi:MFS family permease